MRKEVYETGSPLDHTYVTYYDDEDKVAMVKAKKSYNGFTDWRSTTCYADFGEKRLRSSINFKTEEDDGSYRIKFNYYDDGSLKSARLRTEFGSINLKYTPDGKLETLEKTEGREKNTFRYTYAKNKKLDNYSILSAEGLIRTYSNYYIDFTGGFELFDDITDSENFAKLQKKGIIVTTKTPKKQRKAERSLTDEEKNAAFAMLKSHKSKQDAMSIAGRLEKLKKKFDLIGKDIKALDGGLIAVAKIYEHNSWKRNDSTTCSNGIQWVYELDGAIVDIQKGEIISTVNFDHIVRDSNDSRRDVWSRINTDTLIRNDGETVEFYMGNNYDIITSEEVDINLALRIHESKKHIEQSKTEKTTEPSTTSKPSSRGGKSGFGHDI